MKETILFKRQLGFDNLLNYDYFSSKIVKNYYEKKQFYILKKDLFPKSIEGIENLEFSKCGSFIATSSRNDLIIWKIRNINTERQLKIEIAQGYSNCFGFNNEATSIVYSINPNIFINDLETRKIIKKLSFKDSVNQIDISSSNIVRFITEKKLMSYDSRIFDSKEIKIKNFQEKFLSLHHHPTEDNFLLISCSSSISTLDLRNNQLVKKYYLPSGIIYFGHRAMYNKTGTKILVESYFPTLFDVKHDYPEFEFDHYGFSNRYLRDKNCCFAGLQDEYIVSASDVLNIFMWKIPQNTNEDFMTKKVKTADIVLPADNCFGLRYNDQRSMLISYGWSNTVNIFSPFIFSNDCKKIEISDNEMSNEEFRKNYNNIIYLLAIESLIDEDERNFNLEKVLDSQVLNMEIDFNQNMYIRYLKTLIINYIKTDKKFYSDRLKNLKQTNFIQNGNRIVNLFLLETMKLFENRFLIASSINALEQYIFSFNKTKKKLTLLISKKPSAEKKERLDALKRIILTIQCILYDLIVIIKSNKELYEVSFQILEKILRFYGDERELSRIKKNFFQQVYYFDDSSISSLDFSIKIDNHKELSLLNYYSENNLYELEYDFSFKKKMKKLLRENNIIIITI